MLYFFLKPILSVDKFERQLEAADGDVRVFCQPVTQFKQEILKWAEFTQKGEFLCDFQDVLGLILKDELQILDLKLILEKWNSSFDFLGVGVGTCKLDAYKALCCSIQCGSGGINFYSPEMDEKLGLNKNDEQPQAQSQFELDLPEFEPQKEDKKEKLPPLKNKILETLQLMKEKAPVIAQLKQADPQAFAAVMKIVETLTAIAQNGLLKTEKLVGGVGDGAKDEEFDEKELEMGIAHEMEHTKDPAIAKEIAKDHLRENFAYYSELKALEKKGENYFPKEVQVQKPDGHKVHGFTDPTNQIVPTTETDQETLEQKATTAKPLAGAILGPEGQLKGVAGKRGDRRGG